MSLEVQLEQACLAVLAGQNNAAIQDASKYLNTQAKKVTSIMAFHALLTRHDNPGVSHDQLFFLLFLPYAGNE